MLTSCVQIRAYEDLRDERNALRAENEKLLMFIAGAHEDNEMLQKALIEQETTLRALAGGMQVQAGITADLRRQCDI